MEIWPDHTARSRQRSPRLPSRLLPVAIALSEGSSPAARSSSIALARTYGTSGIEMSVFMEDLDEVFSAVEGGTAPADLLRSCADAWTRAMLLALEERCCRDPLTGLATAGHMRAVVADIVRSKCSSDATFTAVIVVVGFARNDEVDVTPGPRTFEKPQLAAIGEAIQSNLDCVCISEVAEGRLAVIASDGPEVEWQVSRALIELQNSSSAFYIVGMKRVPLPSEGEDMEWWLDELRRFGDNELDRVGGDSEFFGTRGWNGEHDVYSR